MNDEIAARKELERMKDTVANELEDLTKTLFEEANGMVANEAKARTLIENSKLKLQSELEDTRKRLELERQQLIALKKEMKFIFIILSV